ncbi:MAG TPA: tRNA (adenosine(37)-N6)-threonylcarbamoyltransferase complex ATPase subunit type 1 TsaE [Candidatus Hydrogenedens sp.]|nr:tRNA (adenosine(37)-N6)-threonylcarbamoyltransferase complex ATPase subunit type 1 TsaE [Candidatus Hydrogenedens sp.]
MITSSNNAYITIITSSPEQTEELGHHFAKCLNSNSKVALIGDLATGKTCFVKGVVKALCGDCWVHSPTFTIMNQYGNPPKVLHLDCYRIKDAKEIIDIGSEEWLSDNLVCLIEWADRIINIIPPETIFMYFYHIENDKRKIDIYHSHHDFINNLLQHLPSYFLEK